MEKFGSQLFIEGEDNSLFVYFHLHDFSINRALEILEKYAEDFRERDFENINIAFCNMGAPGEHLSLYRKTNNRVLGRILKGIKCISAKFQYKDNLKIVNKPRLFTKRN